MTSVGRQRHHNLRLIVTPTAVVGWVQDVRWSFDAIRVWPAWTRSGQVVASPRPSACRAASRKFTGIVHVTGQVVRLAASAGTLNHYWADGLPDCPATPPRMRPSNRRYPCGRGF
jgi:hypothetical protein